MITVLPEGFTSKPTSPTVFNIQAPNWVHYEKEPGAHTRITRQTYKLVSLFLQIFKVIYFAKKNAFK